MRLIDAEKLKEYLDKKYSFGTDLKFMLFDEIDNQPTVSIEQIRAEIFNEIMPILIDIVDKEGCCYGYEQEIDRLEYEWKQLKELKV